MTGWKSLRVLQLRAAAEAEIRRHLDQVVDACLQCPAHEVTIENVSIGVRTLANLVTLDDAAILRLACEALDRVHARQEAT